MYNRSIVRKGLINQIGIFCLFCYLVAPTSLHAGNDLCFSEIDSLPSATIGKAAAGNFQLPFFSLQAYPPPTVVGGYNDLDPPGQGGLLGRYSVLGEDVVYAVPTGLLALGVIYLLPESVSNWDRDSITFDNGWELWKEDVTHWEWDGDAAWINYIGHPYFGSAYYIHARHYGYSRLESFWFSFLASAFYEVGLEAWAERVSIQDIIFTPLFGWAVAEFLLPLEERIKNNNNEVLNSEFLGSLSLFLIDPFGHILLPIKRWIKGDEVAKNTEFHLSPVLVEQPYYKADNFEQTAANRSYYGLFLSVQF